MKKKPIAAVKKAITTVKRKVKAIPSKLPNSWKLKDDFAGNDEYRAMKARKAAKKRK